MERAWKDNSNYTKDPKLPKINLQGLEIRQPIVLSQNENVLNKGNPLQTVVHINFKCH